MSIARLFPSGAWQCSAIRHGYLIQRTYYGYTKREAIAKFKARLVQS